MDKDNISNATESAPQPKPDVEDVFRVYEQTVSEFLSVADVKKVYGEPVVSNGQTIIPAAEVLAGIGFGIGAGNGPTSDSDDQASGSGGGGGGGGRTFARPVAVIIAGPQGVEIQPVFDITKIALTALTAFGFMLVTMARMQRAPRGD
ncbi:MAG: spore germination protein GerW family protein [Anaerolineaceae bacterium]|nr:spore germination protein GerW family protein [Anaerolineaceae bacterium]